MGGPQCPPDKANEENTMHVLQGLKTQIITSPRAINDNTAYTTNTIDTIGFKELLITIIFGAMDIAVAALKLTESDDSGMSGAVDVSGADFSVSPATLPSGSADDTVVQIHVNLTGARKRYMDLSFTAGDGAAGTYAAVVSQLGGGESVPASATARGAGQFLHV